MTQLTTQFKKDKDRPTRKNPRHGAEEKNIEVFATPMGRKIKK